MRDIYGIPVFSVSLDKRSEPLVRVFLKGCETTEAVFLTAALSDFAVFFAALEATERIEGEERLAMELLRHMVSKTGGFLYDILQHIYIGIACLCGCQSILLQLNLLHTVGPEHEASVNL
jgi:hypothetical protein